MGELLLAMAVFIGTHELMSHPLRKSLVARLGEQGFLGLYSLVALVTFVWTVVAWHRSDLVPLWQASPAVLMLGHLAMLLAAILFAGSLIVPNPALPMMAGGLAANPEPRGILRITRHPMMWGFGLWAAAHIAMDGTLGMLIFAGGMGLLALGGAAMQDRKKALLLGDAWRGYTARTSFVPFGKGNVWPGVAPILAGVALYALLIWAHPLVVGVSTGLV
jgi:uncharacterized membrane protein